MDPDLALIVIAVISLAAIVGRTVVKITNARLAAGTGQSDELKARVEELESTVHGLQQELVEAQERLDFAERLLGKGGGQAARRGLGDGPRMGLRSKVVRGRRGGLIACRALLQLAHRRGALPKACDRLWFTGY